ncbi:hypothetical protein J8380_14305 [Candidatus Thiothrix anitrata]|jgi:hypothetical protein|uniref:Uncharacterized protein n=2 Tax=Candidatus Thiothrix anitrata TaxID=2823902 RepID=A0ABX7X9D7_9GAMM|nr:hypothetical protein J8380_14305 [Candidatus Thiothrix anitrata]
MGLLAAIGVLLVLFGVSVLIIAGVRHFFPSTENWIPDEFRRALSCQFAAYYVLAGLLLLLIQPA